MSKDKKRILFRKKFFAVEPRICSSLNIQGATCKLAAMSCGINLSPPSKREMKDISQELEWMQLEEHQPGSAATGGGGMGTDDTTQTEHLEASSSVAAGDRFPAHLNSFCRTASPGDTCTNTKSCNVLLEEFRTNGERHNTAEICRTT